LTYKGVHNPLHAVTIFALFYSTKVQSRGQSAGLSPRLPSKPEYNRAKME
jgi:hypothetical protein